MTVEEKSKEKSFDKILLCLIVILVIVGLVFLYSTSAYNGRVKFHDSAYYFKNSYLPHL